MLSSLAYIVVLSIVPAVCLFSYCKSRNFKRQETHDNNVTASRSHTRSGARQPVPSSIFIVPTTSQVMEMYFNRLNNEGEQSRSEQTKPPPDYGQVAVDVLPSYDEAIVRSAGNLVH